MHKYKFKSRKIARRMSKYKQCAIGVRRINKQFKMDWRKYAASPVTKHDKPLFCV